jgi:hypothetical protein
MMASEVMHMQIKFVGKQLPGRDRAAHSEDDAIVAQLKLHPGEWGEIGRSALQISRSDLLRRFKKLGVDAKSRADVTTKERVYYARWPENGQ